MNERQQAKCFYCGQERACCVWEIGRRKRYVCKSLDCVSAAAGDEYDADQELWEAECRAEQEAEAERDEEEAAREAYERAEYEAREDGFSRYGGPGRW